MATRPATNTDPSRGIDHYDALVVGAGAVGGFAALLLAEAGLRVLVLDAGLPRSVLRKPLQWTVGRLVRALANPSALRYVNPALSYKARSFLKLLARHRQSIQCRCYAWDHAPDAFVDDTECPYSTPEPNPFTWLRCRQVGGRLALPTHGRQYYRFSKLDFAPMDGLSPAWPFPAEELNPWYELIERRLRLTGTYEDIAAVPDSEISEVLVPTPAEMAVMARLKDSWPGVAIMPGRFAPPLNTIELAVRTGRVQVCQGAVVREVNLNDVGELRGVTWVDARRRSERRAHAPLVFLCASALETTRILMLSRSKRHPKGLGGASGTLGRFLMDHVMLKLEGIGPHLPPGPLPGLGRCIYLPHFNRRNPGSPRTSRGFGVQLYQSPGAGDRSYFIAVSFGEMLPRNQNCVSIDETLRDAWGVPALHIKCSYGDSELSLGRQQATALQELADALGVRVTSFDGVPVTPGSASHECGTARMGTSPTNSVLNPYNECWDVGGVYVTDGACFPSQGSQNPTLTMLALTARACNHALMPTERFRSLEITR